MLTALLIAVIALYLLGGIMAGVILYHSSSKGEWFKVTVVTILWPLALVFNLLWCLWDEFKGALR